jgi:hypothetical protein
MKNISILSVLILSLCFFTNTTFAQATAGATAGASADATANGNNSVIDVNATGGRSSSVSESLSISGDSQASSLTGPSSAEIGDVSPTQNTVIQSKTNIPTPPPIPGFPMVNQTPQIFGPLGKTFNEAGLDVTDVLESICPSRAVSGINITKRSMTSWFNDERINFVPHIDYVLQEENKSFVRRSSMIKVGSSGYYNCVGIITATAKPGDALDVSFASLRNEVLQKITRDLKGYEEIKVFISNNARVVTPAVGSTGVSLGIGGGGSTTPSSIFLGGATGASMSTTTTFPRGMVGFTAVLLSETVADDPNAVFISFKDENDLPEKNVYKNGVDAGKKNSLIQQ